MRFRLVIPAALQYAENIASDVRAADWENSYWNSVDVMDLSPTQRKHFKEIMRKEVRK